MSKRVRKVRLTPKPPRAKSKRPPAPRDDGGHSLTVYSAEIGAKICGDLAQGRTLTSICKDKSLPSAATVLGWASDPKHEFAPMYDTARRVGYLYLADQMLDVATRPDNDSGSVNRDRLTVDTFKWTPLASIPGAFQLGALAVQARPCTRLIGQVFFSVR